MAERTVVVASAVGLHARPASLFSQAAGRAPMPVTVADERGRTIAANSILSILSLNVGHGDRVTIRAEGDGAEEVVAELAAMLETDLDRE